VTVETVQFKNLRITGGTQPREEISNKTVDEYAEAIRAGVDLPPVVVFRDGATQWLVDGFHRYWAHKRAGKGAIKADVHEGTHRDAILFSLSINDTHGLRRTNADKRKAVTTMLTNELVSVDGDGNSWSDRAIAKQCNVSDHLVAQIRSELRECAVGEDEQPRAYTQKRGAKTIKTVMKTSKIGKRRKLGGIAKGAAKPVVGHSKDDKTTLLDLPHNPHWAARALISALGVDFARALITELTKSLKGKNE